jgi:ATP-dependent DNA ligase
MGAVGLKFGAIEPMEAKLVAELPVTGQWQFEPKWDGFAASYSAAATRLRYRQNPASR